MDEPALCQHCFQRAAGSLVAVSEWIGPLLLCDQHARWYVQRGAEVITLGEERQEDTMAKRPTGKKIPEELGARFGETVDPTEGPVEGEYLGSRSVETIDPDGKGRVSLVHDFEGEDGGMVSVWGTYDLDQKLTPEQKGRWVEINYLKTITIQGGRQQLKLFKVTAI